MAARYQASSEAAIIGLSAACGATVLDGEAVVVLASMAS
jgi:hypothetical protein